MNTAQLLEDEYSRTFWRWYYTPRWRLIARLRRSLEWKLWLRAMSNEIKRAASR